jgi:hypothetical protein
MAELIGPPFIDRNFDLLEARFALMRVQRIDEGAED